MSVEDFNNGLIMGLSLQGTMFVDKKTSEATGIVSDVRLINPIAGIVTEILKYEDYI